jgi:hypothetical protein
MSLLPALLSPLVLACAMATSPPPAPRAPAQPAPAKPAASANAPAAPPAAAPAMPAAPSARALPAPPAEEEAPAALTIYNADFAVVRELVPLTLRAGSSDVAVSGMSALLEPDSVILRDPTGRVSLSILEQNYRNDPVTQERLLDLYEGQTIDFLVQRGEIQERVKGRIVRSGYVPVTPAQLRQQQMHGYAPPTISQPIIDVGGELRFSLPGLPLFPRLADDTVMEPTLAWTIASDADATLAAELAYVTGGLSWQADYNVVAPEVGDALDLVGWITMENHCGKTFRDARIKLLAGDVNKLTPQDECDQYLGMKRGFEMAAMSGAPVTKKTFDEYHLYTVARPTTLHDRETKQVEMVRADGVKSTRLYVYDGAQLDDSWQWNDIRNYGDYGTQSNKKVFVMREFRNSLEDGLGMPLPKGRMRFYRRDTDGALEFTGENLIDHTPKDEMLRVYTGNAFDVVGERTRTDYRVDDDRDTLDESFEITLRNHKTEAVTVRVVEHLYRWVNWELAKHSHEYEKKDARTVEFTVTVPPDGEQTVTYTAHYTW